MFSKLFAGMESTNSVDEFCIIFTLTPYLEKREKIELKCSSTIKDKFLSDIEIRI